MISAGFVVASYWFKKAIDVAVLVSTLTALIWYILAMGCLLKLRSREPALFAHDGAGWILYGGDSVDVFGTDAPRLEMIDLASSGRLANSRAPIVVAPKSVASPNNETKTRAVTSDP